MHLFAMNENLNPKILIQWTLNSVPYVYTHKLYCYQVLGSSTFCMARVVYVVSATLTRPKLYDEVKPVLHSQNSAPSAPKHFSLGIDSSNYSGNINMLRHRVLLQSLSVKAPMYFIAVGFCGYMQVIRRKLSQKYCWYQQYKFVALIFTFPLYVGLYTEFDIIVYLMASAIYRTSDHNIFPHGYMSALHFHVFSIYLYLTFIHLYSFYLFALLSVSDHIRASSAD